MEKSTRTFLITIIIVGLIGFGIVLYSKQKQAEKCFVLREEGVYKEDDCFVLCSELFNDPTNRENCGHRCATDVINCRMAGELPES